MGEVVEIQKKAEWRRVAMWACYIAAAGLFLSAAIPKVLAPRDFAVDVLRYRLLRDSVVNGVALVIPWMEIVAALALLFIKPFRQAAIFLMAGLLCLFTVSLISARLRGISLHCGCFSVHGSNTPVSLWLIARDLALLAGVVALGIASQVADHKPPAG